jgi:hypothetical protein
VQNTNLPISLPSGLYRLVVRKHSDVSESFVTSIFSVGEEAKQRIQFRHTAEHVSSGFATVSFSDPEEGILHDLPWRRAVSEIYRLKTQETDPLIFAIIPKVIFVTLKTL